MLPVSRAARFCVPSHVSCVRLSARELLLLKTRVSNSSNLCLSVNTKDALESATFGLELKRSGFSRVTLSLERIISSCYIVGLTCHVSTGVSEATKATTAM